MILTKQLKIILMQTNQENKFAQYRLGNIYADKENEEQYDLDKALEYFENSVKNEFDPAKYKAGKIYLDKESGHYDLAKGMDYMKELADKENDMAQYTLGRILRIRNQEPMMQKGDGISYAFSRAWK